MSDLEAETILRVLAQDIPDVGDTFTCDDGGGPEHYRVTAWLRRYVPPPPPPELAGLLADMPEPAGFGPDAVPLAFCSRREAGYVAAVGVSGRIVRVSGVRVDGRVPWSAETLADARAHAQMLIGDRLF